MSSGNWIYSELKSHEKVMQFRNTLDRIRKWPENHHPILVSIADQFLNTNKISRKQFTFAYGQILREEKAQRDARNYPRPKPKITLAKKNKEDV